MIVLVIASDVGGQQPHHVVAEVTVFTWPETEVKVVGHEAIAEQAHGDALAGFVQEIDEGMKIAIVMEDGAAAVTAIEDVVAIAALGSSCGPWHEVDYRKKQPNRQE
jgi:hypothetical protein